MLHFGPSLFVTPAKWPLVNCTSLDLTKREACVVFCGLAKFGIPDLPLANKIRLVTRRHDHLWALFLKAREIALSYV